MIKSGERWRHSAAVACLATDFCCLWGNESMLINLCNFSASATYCHPTIGWATDRLTRIQMREIEIKAAQLLWKFVGVLECLVSVQSVPPFIIMGCFFTLWNAMNHIYSVGLEGRFMARAQPEIVFILLPSLIVCCARYLHQCHTRWHGVLAQATGANCLWLIVLASPWMYYTY